MRKKIETIPFYHSDPEHINSLVEIWNEACGADLAITNRFITFNTTPVTGVHQVGVLAAKDRPIGFVLCSTTNLFGNPAQGAVDAIAVLPSEQKQGIGAVLLQQAEIWLKGQGCKTIEPIANPRIFTPGVPVDTGSIGFFLKQGFQQDPEDPFIWDMARSLKDYDSPYPTRHIQASLKPVQPGQKALLDAMIGEGFSSFWLYEFREMLRVGGRLDEYLVLWVEGEPVGFCQVAFEDSVRPIERFYMHRLPHPWGQMGTFGILESQRGKGYGAILIDSAARYLKDRGVDGCVIDWTAYLDLYGKFGFTPYRQYAVMRKSLNLSA
jgi:GNAT superfamily N-acetyltransferase